MAEFPKGNAWDDQKAAIVARIEAHRGELESAQDVRQMALIQGQIISLRALLSDAEPEYREGSGHARYWR